MNPVTALEIYEALLEVYKIYSTKNIILAGLIGFTLGITISMTILLGSLLKEDKKSRKKVKDS